MVSHPFESIKIILTIGTALYCGGKLYVTLGGTLEFRVLTKTRLFPYVSAT
jgi:hypothetical protein